MSEATDKINALAAKLKGTDHDDKPIVTSQGPNSNGEADAKANFGASELKLGGVTKIMREAGDEHTGKAKQPEHVVQQGGGGAVRPSGKPI